jgi:dynein assembly factor 3
MTEAGNQQSGMGIIQWWGFSPAIDILNLIKPKSTQNSNNEINILIDGAGDIRNVLQTLSRQHRHSTESRINIYILENQIEIYARQMLLLLLISEPSSILSLSTKADMYLDVTGNILNRPFTSAYIQQKSTVMSEMIVDLGYAAQRAEFINFDFLKFKDRDRLDDQFKFWRDGNKFQVKEQWDIRQRQYLGARYDHRRGDFDWKVNMQFAERQATVVTKEPYSRFRENGVAFEPFEEGSYTIPNKTISSSRVMTNQRGDKNAFRGYWGDIVVSPLICHGIESENENLFKTQNKLPTHNADQISRWNITAAIYELFNQQKYKSELRKDYFQFEEIDETEEGGEIVSTKLVKRKETYKSVKMKNNKIYFITPDNSTNWMKLKKFENKFDAIFLSVSNSKKLSQNLNNCLTQNGIIIVETSKYILDLKKEQLQQHIKSVKAMAIDANLKEVGMSNILSPKIIFQKS